MKANGPQAGIRSTKSISVKDERISHHDNNERLKLPHQMYNNATDRINADTISLGKYAFKENVNQNLKKKSTTDTRNTQALNTNCA
jgi:hypothetical protein